MFLFLCVWLVPTLLIYLYLFCLKFYLFKKGYIPTNSFKNFSYVFRGIAFIFCHAPLVNIWFLGCCMYFTPAVIKDFKYYAS